MNSLSLSVSLSLSLDDRTWSLKISKRTTMRSSNDDTFRLTEFKGRWRATTLAGGGHLLWIITRRKPPLMRLRDLKNLVPRRIQTFLLILIPLLLLCSLSPLFPRQVNNSSSFTYPTPEFIMEIILFVPSLVLVLSLSLSLGKVQACRR